MIKFKTPREGKEWQALRKNNKPLIAVIKDAARFLSDLGAKDITITSIYRSGAEQVALYAPNPAPVSPHTFYGAVDLRSRDLNAQQIAALVGYLNNHYKNSSGKQVALFHTLPNGAPHLHIQYRA